MMSQVGACLLPGTEVWDMTSLYNGLTYRVFVHLPLKPPPPEGYPVLYTVDGNAYFASLNDAMRLQTRHPRGFRPVWWYPSVIRQTGRLWLSGASGT